tara:strand:- start:24610 stop:25560 length:951 start_codon:yes stop_codon:yes gene_type:complete
MKVKLGTRGSPLALVQANLIKKALETNCKDIDVEIITIKTLGDRKQGTPEASNSDKQDWVHDLECAILDQTIDFAVHSGKDVPAEIMAETALLPAMPRANPLDTFIGRLDPHTGVRLLFSELPQGAKVGTASLRRKAELLKLRPDLNIVEHRGNVRTRLAKMDKSDDIMGIVLACAGLERLGYDDLVHEPFNAEDMMPAVNQGILTVQFHANNSALVLLLQELADNNTYAEWQAERAVVELLEGDCKSAMSIFAQCLGESLTISSRVMSEDAQTSVHYRTTGNKVDAGILGATVGKNLLEQGADKIIESSRNSPNK